MVYVIIRVYRGCYVNEGFNIWSKLKFAGEEVEWKCIFEVNIKLKKI